MNIFYTSHCPVECAENLDTKRVIKMILETAQILSTAMRVNGYTGDQAYKITHRNHPSVKWACESRQNFEWLTSHFIALSNVYTLRRGKVHKSTAMARLFVLNSQIVPSLGYSSPPNCAANASLGISYKHIEDITKAYKLYLNERWENDKLEPTWR